MPSSFPPNYIALEPAALYNRALIGMVNGELCYDYQLILVLLARHYGWETEEAIEFFESQLAQTPGVCFLIRLAN